MREEDDRPIGRTNAVVAGKRRVIPWIWEGVVAEEAVTLLSAPEKVGKTTLLSLLLDRRRAGGEQPDRKHLARLQPRLRPRLDHGRAEWNPPVHRQQ